MAEQWQTYAEAAKTLGLSLEGLRQRARRESWRKTLGNDGKARVMVPFDTTAPGGDAGGNQTDAKASTGRSPGKQPGGEIQALQARIDELKIDLERERGERLQERDRADRMAGELTEMARELSRAVQDAAARERDLHAKLDASRSWWPFKKAV